MPSSKTEDRSDGGAATEQAGSTKARKKPDIERFFSEEHLKLQVGQAGIRPCPVRLRHEVAEEALETGRHDFGEGSGSGLST